MFDNQEELEIYEERLQGLIKESRNRYFVNMLCNLHNAGVVYEEDSKSIDDINPNIYAILVEELLNFIENGEHEELRYLLYSSFTFMRKGYNRNSIIEVIKLRAAVGLEIHHEAAKETFIGVKKEIIDREFENPFLEKEVRRK